MRQKPTKTINFTILVRGLKVNMVQSLKVSESINWTLLVGTFKAKISKFKPSQHFFRKVLAEVKD